MEDVHVVLNMAVLDRIVAQCPQKADAVVGKLALDTDANAKNLLTGPRTGRIYDKPGGVKHQASAPGEPPATDTGNLRNSIVAKKIGHMHHEVWVGAEYGADLEYGTRKMAARPYLLPAVRQTLDDVPPELLKEVVT